MTRKISNYRVLAKDSRKVLVESVCKMILEGWEPLGGVASIIIDDHSFLLLQAMIYKKDNHDSQD